MTKIVFVDNNDDTVSHDSDRLALAGIKTTFAGLSSPTEEDVVSACQGHAVLVSSRVPITRSILKQLPDLKMLCAPQVGIDHFDISAAQEMGLKIGHSAYCNYTEVATHALAMALMLVRQIPTLQRHTARGGWKFSAAGSLHRPATMTLGIIGLGRIGKAFAERAIPTFGKVVGYDPYLSPDAWPKNVVRDDKLQDTLAQSHIISVHVSLSETSRGMINADFLATLPKGAFVINTSRGEVADTSAIVDALNSGHIAGAGLDVLSTEPPCPDDPILTHPNAVITPHSAFFSEQSRLEKYSMVTDNVLSFIETGNPKYNALKA